MKTIEEKAIEYANAGTTLFMDTAEEDIIYRDGLALSYAAGAKWIREELTRWNDPKESLPEYYKSVMIKFRQSGLIRMAVAWLSAGDAGEYLWTIDGTNVLVNEKKVIGWRPIHE